ncbi:MAG: hypothetical protein JNK65_01370 [Deltaproteobacteria bacterium]|nr:hypothetical protein [Deltaproteobacteria bacterium]
MRKLLIQILCSMLLWNSFFYPVRAIAEEESSGIEIPRINMFFKEIKDIPVTDLRNYVVTNPGILNVENLTGNSLKVEAINQGTSFIHIWDAKGRHSYEIVVSLFIAEDPLKKIRQSYDPKGPQFTYRIESTVDYLGNQQFREIYYNHDFDAFIPLKNDWVWKTSLRATTDPNLKSGPNGAPFSQATEPTYMLSYLRNKNWTLGAGDIFYNTSELSLRGFPIRGGTLQYRRNQDEIQLFGGWYRPIYGLGEYLNIQPQKVYGAAGTKEIFPNILLKPSFVFLDQSNAPARFGKTFQDDFVGALSLEAKPFTENFTFEAEYGRSKQDNAYRGLLEYRPFWGRLLGTYKRIGANYIDLSTGFLIRDFQEGTFSALGRPFRRIDITAGYSYNEQGLSVGTNHSVGHNAYLGTRFKKDPNTDFTWTIYTTRADSNFSDFEEERGTFTFQKYWGDRRSNFYLQSGGRHTKRSEVSNLYEEYGGNLDTRLTKSINRKTIFNLTNIFDMAKASSSGSISNVNSLNTRISLSPSMSYIEGYLNILGGFIFNGQWVSSNQNYNLQPYFSIYYRPSQAINVGLSTNWIFDLTQKTITGSLKTEVVYRFGSGVPDSLFSTFSKNSLVEGHVFLDKNGDGIFDENIDSLLDGYSIQIDDQTPKKAEKGIYKVGFPAGEHKIQIIIPEGSKLKPTTVSSLPLNMNPNQKMKLDWGLSEGAVLKGKVILDLNGNSKIDEGEIAPPGTKVKIKGPSSQRVVSVSRAGQYQFFAPELGSYQAEVDLISMPSGYQIEGQSPVSAEASSETLNSFPDLFITAQRVVLGRAFIDENGNGLFEENEKPLSGIKVQVGPYRTQTDAEGYYIIKNIEAKSYPVLVTPFEMNGMKVNWPKTLSFDLEAKKIEMNLPFKK